MLDLLMRKKTKKNDDSNITKKKNECSRLETVKDIKSRLNVFLIFCERLIFLGESETQETEGKKNTFKISIHFFSSDLNHNRIIKSIQ